MSLAGIRPIGPPRRPSGGCLRARLATASVGPSISSSVVVLAAGLAACAPAVSAGPASGAGDAGPEGVALGASALGPEDATVGTTRTSTGPRAIYRSHFAMGTQITITVYTADEPAALEVIDAAFREFGRLEGLLTTWRPDSDVSRLNEAAGRAPVEVHPETMDVLVLAKEGGARTKGKFDVTFGALSGLWRFDHDQDDSIPPRAEVERRVGLVDQRRLILDPAKRTAFLQRAGMKVHLGGIGKGFGVDRAVALIRGRGFRDFMVQAGGDLFVAGTHGRRAWRVGIRDPRGPASSYFAATEITDATFSTSGDYERFFFKDGRRYHHILDPATGAPATACRSVTIMAKDATTAEWLSKGVFILGPKEGLALVESVEGAGAVIVDRNNELHISKRLEGRMKILFPPTDAP